MAAADVRHRRGEREGRDRLRKELGVLGWAQLSASTWISPADTLDAAREAAARSRQPSTPSTCSAASYRGPLDDRELSNAAGTSTRSPRRTASSSLATSRGWPRERERGGLADEDAFVERLWLVHDYRKFAYLDPGPAERTGAGALAGHDRRRLALSRILRRARRQIATLLSSLHAGVKRVRASGRRSDPAMPKRLLLLLAVAALAIVACNNSSATPTPSSSPVSPHPDPSITKAAVLVTILGTPQPHIPVEESTPKNSSSPRPGTPFDDRRIRQERRGALLPPQAEQDVLLGGDHRFASSFPSARAGPSGRGRRST